MQEFGCIWFFIDPDTRPLGPSFIAACDLVCGGFIRSFSFLFWRTRRIITIAQLTSLPDISKQMISRLGLRSIVQPLNMTTIRPTHILPKVLGCTTYFPDGWAWDFFLLLTKFFPGGLWKAFQYFQTLKKEQTSYSWRQWLLLFLRLANCIWPFWKFNRRGSVERLGANLRNSGSRLGSL